MSHLPNNYNCFNFFSQYFTVSANYFQNFFERLDLIFGNHLEQPHGDRPHHRSPITMASQCFDVVDDLMREKLLLAFADHKIPRNLTSTQFVASIPSPSLSVIFANSTQQGTTRKINEDHFFTQEFNNSYLAVVMDGHRDCRNISNLIETNFLPIFLKQRAKYPENMVSSFEKTFIELDKSIFEAQECGQIPKIGGVCLFAAFIDKKHGYGYFATLGDVEGFVLRDDQLFPLSPMERWSSSIKRASLINKDLVDTWSKVPPQDRRMPDLSGLNMTRSLGDRQLFVTKSATEEVMSQLGQLESYEYEIVEGVSKNVILRTTVPVPLVTSAPLRTGDTILIATDGVVNGLNTSEITQIAVNNFFQNIPLKLTQSAAKSGDDRTALAIKLL